MPITRDEAAGVLKDIDLTQRRSSTAYGYHMASPYLILWGAVWVVGYGVSYARPDWGIVWLPLAILGSAASFWIGVRGRPKGQSYDWRFTATFLALFAFVIALFNVMPPRTENAGAAFFPLLVALFYALVGIWARAPRILWTGAVLMALTLFGFFALPQLFILWMAVVGGGGLILGGLWLRSV